MARLDAPRNLAGAAAQQWAARAWPSARTVSVRLRAALHQAPAVANELHGRLLDILDGLSRHAYLCGDGALCVPSVPAGSSARRARVSSWPAQARGEPWLELATWRCARTCGPSAPTRAPAWGGEQLRVGHQLTPRGWRGRPGHGGRRRSSKRLGGRDRCEWPHVLVCARDAAFGM